MKTIIEFFTDPQTGEKPALALIKQIGIEGKKDPDRLQMYALILRGMEFLRTHGLQDSFKEYFKTHLEDGNPYTILLVKELRDHVPLLEFRVNWKETGGFRAIFFEQQIDGNQILIFVNAVVKKKTYDPNFERIVVEAEKAYTSYEADQE
ncbi:hypothetical protein BSK66_27880 [Paenibacillus odorifer]|uniref:hypothetical protein n=1 Tax=Paenibacillus TaxID=44249 RepID=UPI0003E1DAEE|nr:MULTISPECIES: hypothetical protein [Paenibacillus]ETT61819.1 hypothetical protein C171_11681 [Paenibacillus sp. FSL H8-237]OMD13778.1 hypothetical protein BJP47_24430 [Paenibacillus odorifer]OME49008.1 hypothetical protein BSK66_27880 [Paenibacillus odorifer]